jgi:hypothetical protein
VIVSNEAELPPAHAKAVPPALLALLAPDTGMERQAKVGGVKLAFLIAFGCALLAGGMQAWRVDARAATLQRLEKQGQLQNMSDRQVADETRNAERVFQVTRIAGAAADAPLQLGLTCLVVLGLGWFLKGRVKGSAVAPVAAATLLPGAIANLLDAVAAFRHSSIPAQGAQLAPRTVSALFAVFEHPLMGPWAKLGNALDFFSLWAALMLAYGVAFAGQIPVKRALIGTMVAWVCLRLLTRVATGG